MRLDGSGDHHRLLCNFRLIEICFYFISSNGKKLECKSAPRSQLKTEIYIQIPAYRDAELSKTVLSLYNNAAAPKRIRLAVMWQHGAEDKLDKRVLSLPNLELFRVPFSESSGCNWARNYLQQQWSGEPYTLFLDSHHRFVKDWDARLIEMYETLKAAGIRKPVVTAYLPSYDPSRDPHGRLREVMKIYPLQYEKGLLTKLTSFAVVFWKNLALPIRADFVSLHFLFTDGIFNREVLADPDIYFFGDEVVTSLRAFTHGYDFFHPHRILGWHLYDRETRVTHWHDHGCWKAMAEKSLNKIRAIYSGKYVYICRTKQVRSVSEFEASIHTRLIR